MHHGTFIHHTLTAYSLTVNDLRRWRQRARKVSQPVEDAARRGAYPWVTNCCGARLSRCAVCCGFCWSVESLMHYKKTVLSAKKHGFFVRVVTDISI